MTRRRDRPVADGGSASTWNRDRYQTFHSSNEMLMRLLLFEPGADAVGGGDHAVDEVVHVDARRRGSCQVAVELLVVGVAGDVVDLVVGLLEHGRLPRAEGRHAGAGAAAGHQLQARVDRCAWPGRLGGQPAVLVGGLVPDLPGAVHLVAEAPHPDAVRLVGAVRDPQVGQRGAARGGWSTPARPAPPATPRVPRLTAHTSSSTPALRGPARRTRRCRPRWSPGCARPGRGGRGRSVDAGRRRPPSGSRRRSCRRGSGRW